MKPVNYCAGCCATRLTQTDSAARFGEALLGELGVFDMKLGGTSDHPAIAWKRAGMLDLSGEGDSLAKMVPLPLAAAADGALMAIASLSDDAGSLPATGAQLLWERARLMGLTRHGRASPTGHCRLVDCRDGRIALNLAREDDWELLPAWLETPASTWSEVERCASNRMAAELVRRGAEIGLAIALDQECERTNWLVEQRTSRAGRPKSMPLVVDLSSLWAGPLAGNLLHLTGAKVIKVESTARPDGARRGDAEFYRLLNSGKHSVGLDFASDAGRKQLLELVSAADIVIEASRPRALRQLGIDVDALLAAQPGKIWLRLLAHGNEPQRIGFGDDIGVAAGLPSVMERAWGQPLMVGDAIADPLSGLFGALAVLSCRKRSMGGLLTLSMSDVVRRAMGECGNLEATAREWQALADADHSAPYPIRSPNGECEQMGASNARMKELLC